MYIGEYMAATVAVDAAGPAAVVVTWESGGDKSICDDEDCCIS